TGSRLAFRRCCCPRRRRGDGPQCPHRVRNRKAPSTPFRVVAVLLAPHGTVGEGTATTIGDNAWRTVCVVHDHSVAVRVLVQYLGRSVEFFLGDIETKVDGDEVQPAGGEQVVVVYVIVGTPWCVAGLGLLPTGSLFQRFVALGAKVLVVQAVRTNVIADSNSSMAIWRYASSSFRSDAVCQFSMISPVWAAYSILRSSAFSTIQSKVSV